MSSVVTASSFKRSIQIELLLICFESDGGGELEYIHTIRLRTITGIAFVSDDYIKCYPGPSLRLLEELAVLLCHASATGATEATRRVRTDEKRMVRESAG